MRPNFAAVRAGQQEYGEAIAGLDRERLIALTNDYYDEIGALVAGIGDEGVVAVPVDPALEDQSAGEGAWTLGHVIAHLTASCEEMAALGSTLARGVEMAQGQRLRAETPWETIATAAQLADRLAESRRIALAFYDTWPTVPNLDRTVTMIPRFGPFNAVGFCALGLLHADSHLEQLREIARQVREGA